MNLNEYLGKYIEIYIPEDEYNESLHFYVFNLLNIDSDYILADLIYCVDSYGASRVNDVDAFDSNSWIITEFNGKDSLFNKMSLQLKSFVDEKFK